MNAVSIPVRRYRSVFISDIHLGTRGCKAEFLLDFLRNVESDALYLVGDIVDGWRLKRGWYWPQGHNDVVQKLLRKARKGTKVVYVPGNHDEFARVYAGIGSDFGAVKLLLEAEHRTADGKRLLVTHGDAYDGIVLYAKWLALLGDQAYAFALWANHWFNVVRRLLKLPYWSFSLFLKHKVKNASAFITRFEQTMLEEARRRGFDGVVCGHLHYPEVRESNGLLYCNSGDWVESCSALVEHFDGRIEVLEWPRLMVGDAAKASLLQKELAAAASPTPTPETIGFKKVRACVFSWLQMRGFRRSTASSALSAVSKNGLNSADMR